MTHHLDLKEILNPAQHEAVTTLDGALLVVAGAGTGKTRVIEYRVVNLLEHGVKPTSILLLTFTRKAAREMLDRAARHNSESQHVEGGTFHSFGCKIIQTYRNHLGFSNNLSFLDEADSGDVLHLLSSKLGFLDKKLRFPKKDTFRNLISMSINRSQSMKQVLEKDYPQFLDLRHDLEALHKSYLEYKVNHAVIDYDDMLLYLKMLLEKEEITEALSKKFSHIMVDEFQDTNKLQADIVYRLGKLHGNIMAVGDDTQSIYSFRGAYYKNMFEFPKMFANCKILKLERNYRSTQPILDVANAVIEGEKQKYTKVLFTVKQEGEKPELLFFKDAHKEAEFISHRIKELYNQNVNLSSIGVLYRSNHHSLPLQLALSKLNIPFMVYGGIRFIETAHVKDVLSFIKITLNRNDEIAWRRILMMCEGIGPRTAEKIYEVILQQPSLEKALATFLDEKRAKHDLQRMIKLFDKLDNERLSVSEQLREIIDYYAPIMKKKFDDYPMRKDDLRALVQVSSEYKTREEFLVDFVALESPERSLVSLTKKKIDEHPVVLSTIHSAKGLEWENVFIISLMDGCLPSSYSYEDEEGLEEERRLLYVAVTRAKTRLYLSMHNQGHEGGIFSFNRLSRFINDKRVLDKLDIDYDRFNTPNYDKHLSDGMPHIDVNEDDTKVLQKLYDYFDY